MVKTMVCSPVPVELLIHQIRYQFSSNYPLILFNFSSGEVHKYTTVFSHQFSNWASKTHMGLIIAYSHTELSRKGPPKITLNRKRLCLIWPYFFEVLVSDLVLFIFWGGVQRGGLRVVICVYMYIFIYH